jgi:predicted outer membrane protein
MEEESQDLALELKKLKSLIAPVLSFLQELKELKRELHISSENSISAVTLLTSYIRAETLRDLTSLQNRFDEKFMQVSEESQEKQSLAFEKIIACNRQDEHLEFMIKETHDLMAKQGAFMEKLRKDLDYSAREVNEKVGYTEFIKLDKSLKHYAQASEVLMIKTRLDDFAEKSQTAFILKMIEKIKDDVLACFTKQEADKTFGEIQEKIMKDFEKYFFKVSAFESFEHENSKKTIKFEEEMKALMKKLEMFYEGFKRKISELFDLMNSKPWDIEFKHIWQKVEELATNEKLKKFREEMTEKHSSLKKNVTDLESKNKQTDLIITRIDEIMLDKASKDDIFYLNQSIEKYSLSVTVNEIKFELSQKLQALTQQLNQYSAHFEALKTSFGLVSQKVEIMKKENYEVNNIATTLQSIYEVLDRKADKSDIFIIYDIMGKKEDIFKLSEIEDICRKQVLITVGVFQSFCRTFLNSGENPSLVKKQRLDVYKTLEGLQKWIKEGNGEPSTFLSVGRSHLNLKTETWDDIGHSTSARVRGRTRVGSVGTSPRYHKDELPLLNL